MADDGMIGFGTSFQVETYDGSGQFFEIGKVTGITPPANTTDSIEYTHMKSANATRVFGPGLIDPGEMQVDLIWKPGDESDQFILAWQRAREVRKVRIAWPHGVVWPFNSFPTSYSGESPMEDKMTASMTGKVSGSVDPLAA